MEEWGRQWTPSGWKIGDDAGDLAAGRWQAMLETGDTGDLGAGRLGTTIKS